MASKYWIKLYHEILDDPKMGTMPDTLWRRTIELFLIAGELDQDGVLPSVQQIAWKLRITTDECNDSLQQLQQRNIIVTGNNGEFVIKNFAKRQGPSPESERTRRHREHQKAKKAESEPGTTIEPEKEVNPEPNPCNEDVTNRYECNAPDKQITDTDYIESFPNGNAEQPPLVILPETKKGGRGKGKREPKPRASPHPAFKRYTEITGFYSVPTYWKNKVAQDVGENPEDVDFWGNVIIGYTSKWYYGNIGAMLEYYNRREIPNQAQKGHTNGNGRQYPNGNHQGQRSPNSKAATQPNGASPPEDGGIDPEWRHAIEKRTVSYDAPTSSSPGL